MTWYVRRADTQALVAQEVTERRARAAAQDGANRLQVRTEVWTGLPARFVFNVRPQHQCPNCKAWHD